MVAPHEDVVGDPLVSDSEPDQYWTRSNVGEAVPGVMTPLNWSIWGTIGESTTRGSGYGIGALSKHEAQLPADPKDAVLHVFYGRMAISAQYIALLGDRLPGTTGQQAVASVFGRVPDGMAFHPTRRRYPIAAWRLIKSFVLFPRTARKLDAEIDQWWRDCADRGRTLTHREAVVLFQDGMSKFHAALQLQTTAIFGVVQPVYDVLVKVAAKSGVDNVAALSGTGHAEIAVISDIWRASREECSVDEVVLRHGFHGPREGEIASRVWREDDAPLRAMIAHYATRSESENPIAAEAARSLERHHIARRVIDAHPLYQRPLVRVILRFGRTRIPLRGVVKRNFLQALDAGRFAAREIGRHLVEAGVLDDAEDVFFLSRDELTGGPTAAIKRVVVARRRYWESHHHVEIPSVFRGTPVVSALDPDTADKDPAATSVSGIGVSPGVVEGVARVVTNPDFMDVEPDEILIAPFTDPSWSSIMFLSSALVVDVGGALGHAAVVARELGIPCVVNTRNGTTVISTGDRLRVDGTAGTVEILQRAG